MKNLVQLIAKISVEFALFSFLVIIWLLAILTMLDAQSRMPMLIAGMMFSIFIGCLCLLSVLIIFIMIGIAGSEIFE
ncbi:MAG: hypothetical protein DRN15_09460 [Thermoprotei archaeon]|nr:MAG: hypothetical protein DRN15_09460 [Thermoprotei archaeon]